MQQNYTKFTTADEALRAQMEAETKKRDPRPQHAEKPPKSQKTGPFATLRNHPGAFFLHSFLMALVMAGFTVGAFFYVVRPAEQVLVPNVVGMDLADGLLVLQERELYPRLILCYTDSALDKNHILDQSIPVGTISKAGRRITLTVSQGAAITEIENFVGKDLLEAQLHIRALSSGGEVLLTVEPPIYVESDMPANTILSQEPAAGTTLVGKTSLTFTVSKGSPAKPQ